jgi:hypothetical protein
MMRLAHEVATRRLRKASINCNASTNHSYLSIMRGIRDGLGAECFQGFTDLVNYFTRPDYKLTVKLESGSSIAVLPQGQLSNVQAHDIVGVMIKDLQLVEPRNDKEIPREESILRLTDAFILCLNSATRTDPAVIFIDGEESLTQETAQWLWGQFLPKLRDGVLGQVKFILCGRRDPQLDRTWFVAEVRELSPMATGEIVSYLQRRGVDVSQTELERIARFLVGMAEGSMMRIANGVDFYLGNQAA